MKSNGNKTSLDNDKVEFECVFVCVCVCAFVCLCVFIYIHKKGNILDANIKSRILFFKRNQTISGAAGSRCGRGGVHRLLRARTPANAPLCRDSFNFLSHKTF